MMTRRRRLTALAAVLVALWLPAMPAGADEHDRAPKAGGVDAGELGPVEEVGEGGIVHSWTLVPASTEDPDRASSYRPNLSYEAAPGATIEDAVSVFNYGTVPLTFAVFATDAFNNPDGDFDLLPTDEEPEGVGSWVTVAQRNITVPPNGRATMDMTIEVPADARPGDHVGAVLASAPVEGTGPDGKVVTFDRRTGTRLYVRVDGPITPELAVTGIGTTYRPSPNPLDGTAVVTYRIENRGNVRLGAEHVASVAGPFGLLQKRARRGMLKEILPGEEVTIRTPIDGVAATGLAVADVAVEPVPIGDAEGAPSASGSSTTLAPPWTVMALVVVAALALYARRAYGRHEAAGPAMHMAEPRP